MEELWPLPQSWAWVEFRDVADIELELEDAKRFPNAVHIAPNHIESGTGRLLGTGTVVGDKVAGPKHRFKQGQLLYSKIRPYLAKAAIAPSDGFCSSDMYPVQPRCESGFLLNWLVSPAFTHRVAKDQGRTVLPKVNLSTLNGLPVPLPPRNEQRRIVAKLEALQARSRRAREALDAVPPLLEKLRQSILAAAFRGDLTKDWRAQHPDVEPATELLKRIRTERRKKWEESELAKLKAKGKPPTNDSWKAKYKEPEPVDTTGLPELPEGWCWASVDELLEPGGLAYGVLKPGPTVKGGVPMVRVMDIGDGCLSGTPIVQIASALAAEFARTRLKLNDVLLTVMASIGRTMVVPAHLVGANVNRAVSVLRPVDRDAYAEYMSRYFRSPGFRQTFVEKQLGTAQQRINLGDLARFPIPVAPRGEALAVLTAIDRHLARHQGAARALAASLNSLDSLDRATLATAFRGELVPQDPTDEPAEVMLARLGSSGSGECPPRRARRSKAAE